MRGQRVSTVQLSVIATSKPVYCVFFQEVFYRSSYVPEIWFAYRTHCKTSLFLAFRLEARSIFKLYGELRFSALDLSSFSIILQEFIWKISSAIIHFRKRVHILIKESTFQKTRAHFLKNKRFTVPKSKFENVPTGNLREINVKSNEGNHNALVLTLT